MCTHTFRVCVTHTRTELVQLQLVQSTERSTQSVGRSSMQIARRPLSRRSRRPSSTAGFVFVSLPRLNTGNNEGSISGLHPSLAPVGLWVTRHPRARLFLVTGDRHLHMSTSQLHDGRGGRMPGSSAQQEKRETPTTVTNGN